MADAGGKALDIFLHGTEFARKNAIVKTFTQHMHSHPPMHTPKTKSKTLNSLNMTPSFTCALPVQRGGGRRPGAFKMLPRTAPRRRPSRLGQY